MSPFPFFPTWILIMTITPVSLDIVPLPGLLLPSVLGVGTSVALAEITRDVWHLLGHKVPFLWKNLHASHHRAYIKDWKVKSHRQMLESHWFHDVSEAIMMLICTVLFTALCFRSSTPLGIGSLFGVGYTLRILGLGLLTALDVLTPDGNHMPNCYLAPPAEGWKVDQPYHHEHHYGDIESAYSGVSKLLDRVAGTARSLRRKSIGITSGPPLLTEALINELKRRQVRSIILFSPPGEAEDLSQQQDVRRITWQPGQEEDLRETLEAIDILILNHGLQHDAGQNVGRLARSFKFGITSVLRLAEVFFSTITNNERVATRELWVSTTMPVASAKGSPGSALCQRTLAQAIALLQLQAPCILRKVVIGNLFRETGGAVSYPMLTPQWVAKAICFWATRDMRTIVVSLDPIAIATILIQQARDRALQAIQR